MRQDAESTRWNKAWLKFDKQLRMQFTSEPFIINTTHSSYLHGFERARVAQVEERSRNSAAHQDHHPRLPIRHSSLPDNRFHPYNDNRLAGHHAGSSNITPQQPLPFFATSVITPRLYGSGPPSLDTACLIAPRRVSNATPRATASDCPCIIVRETRHGDAYSSSRLNKHLVTLRRDYIFTFTDGHMQRIN